MEKQFYTLFELLTDGAAVMDRSGNILEVNAAARRIFHLHHDQDVTKHHIEDLLARKKLPFLSSLLEDVDQNDSHRSRAIGTKMDEETFPAIVSASAIEADGHQRILVIIHDLSRHKRLEKAYNDLSKKTRRLVYRAGVGQVATGVLHNIGNILNSINISIQNLSTIVKDSKVRELKRANDLFQENRHRIQEYIETDPAGRFLPDFYTNVCGYLEKNDNKLREELLEFQYNINSVKELIATQQTYAKQDGNRKRLNIVTLIGDALKIELRSLLKHGIDVDTQSDQSIYVMAEQAKTLHIFLNIIKNAKESMIAADREERLLNISVNRNSDNTVTAVLTDNGEGISPEDMDSLFTYGFTTKPEGHGFGLYTSLQAMHEMGGDIKVSSDGLDKGASFALTFPTELSIEGVAD